MSAYQPGICPSAVSQVTKNIKCSECPQSFLQKKNLYAHLRKIHNKEPAIGRPTPTLKCQVCGKLFSTNFTLKKHNKTFHAPVQNVQIQGHSNHQESQALKRSKLYCPDADCSTKCKSYEELRAHLQSNHDIITEADTFDFNSLEDFQTWKNEIQIKTLSCYSQETSSKSLKNGIKKTFFNCNRSYKYKTRGKNMRALKHVGSIKIGKACPSRMEVITSELSEEQTTNVHVIFWKTHYGHPAELRHIPLDKETRAEIAGKLQQGVSFNHILDFIRNSDGKGNQRLCLLGKKDLYNIVRDFNLNYVPKQHQNDDAVSVKRGVKVWVEEMVTVEEDSPVLYYQGEDPLSDILESSNKNDTSIVACQEKIKDELENLPNASQNTITNREKKIVKSANLLIGLAGKATVTDQNYKIIKNHLNKCIEILK